MNSRIQARGYLAAIVQEARTGSLRLLCPFCNGGPEREISLVLTIQDDGAFYCCHRAKCGERGVLGGTTRRFLGASGSKIPEKQHQPYTGALLEMGPRNPCHDRVRDRAWGPMLHNLGDAGIYSDESFTREVWVLRNLYGERVGVQVRWRENGKKRVKTYKETRGPVYSIYRTPNALDNLATVWIVEDPLSAAIIGSWNVPAVALCGTYLSQELAFELCQLEPYTSKFVIALDPGAEDAAERAKRTLWTQSLCGVEVRFLQTDVKDMSAVEIDALLGLQRYN